MPEADRFVSSIAAHIEQNIGIKSQVVGDGAWLRAIRKRMEALQITDGKEYYKRLTTFRDELQAFSELVLVPETWFFRDRAALDHLAVWVKARCDEGRTKPWRILSLACATGEEAYSIAMILHDIGIPSHRFSVEGVDVSKKALGVAKAAVYGPNSFRDRLTLMHKRHFDKVAIPRKDFPGIATDRVEGSYLVHKNIRDRVHFSWANVISIQFYARRKKYDVIFCRNLLIYFSSAVQKRVLDICNNLLEDDGLLVMGPTESEVARLAGFVPVGPRNAFTFSKRPKVAAPVADHSWREAAAMKTIHQAIEMAQQKVPQELPISTTDTADRRSEWLNNAMRLADEGRITEAIALCKDYVERFEANADIYFLLGTLYMASRADDEATIYFQKAVYLTPSHYHGLVNLALLAQRRGDKAQAELFWKRARKHYAAEEDPILRSDLVHGG